MQVCHLNQKWPYFIHFLFTSCLMTGCWIASCIHWKKKRDFSNKTEKVITTLVGRGQGVQGQGQGAGGQGAGTQQKARKGKVGSGIPQVAATGGNWKVIFFQHCKYFAFSRKSTTKQVALRKQKKRRVKGLESRKHRPQGWNPYR